MKRVTLLTLPFILAAGIIFLVTILAGTQVEGVQAQCSRPSSCQTCHETQGVFPVQNNGGWHSDHGIYDFCADCHGGSKLVADATIAHRQISTDMNTMQAACASCHSDDYSSLLAGYASQVGAVIDPNFTPPLPTPDPVSNFLGSKPAGVDLDSAASNKAGANAGTGVVNQYNASPTPAASQTGNRILAGLILLVGSGGGSYVYWNENRKRRGVAPGMSSPPEMRTEMGKLANLVGSLGPDGRDALEILLEDPAAGEENLVKLALLEPGVLKDLIEKASKEGKPG